MKKRICRLLYYHFAIYLPQSAKCGGIGKKIRYLLCRNIFDYCGKDVNIEKGARFGKGEHIRIGDRSGLGINCNIPDGSIIGKYVNMGPNCFVHYRNHRFDRTDIPMQQQGYTESKSVIIDDDVWIGRDVTIMIGRHIAKGSIIAANCVLTKDFPEYSIVGGNPGQLIRSRITSE
jgi:maltose O-acetyltransferase